jgi:hypothetical protein
VRGHRQTVENDPGCVKTCASRECAELFSPFSSFDGYSQSCSFPNQPNRDKISTRKFDVGVFTQPGPEADIASYDQPLFDSILLLQLVLHFMRQKGAVQ